jgi:hypothetical protein
MDVTMESIRKAHGHPEHMAETNPETNRMPSTHRLKRTRERPPLRKRKTQ